MSSAQMEFQKRMGCDLDTFCFWHSPESFDYVGAAGGSGGDDRWDNTRYSYNYPQWRERSHGFRPAHVVILGHSFVRRQEQFLIRQHGLDFNLGLDYDRAYVTYVHHGGLTAPQARIGYMDYVLSLTPDIIYIELGSNDICHPRVGPVEVGQSLRDLANDFIRAGVRYVMIGETIPRAGRAIPRVTRSYNNKVRQLNENLHAMFGPHRSDAVRSWRHRGLSHPSVLGPDGVHLNNTGNQRLYRSMRGAILHALSRVRRHLKFYY